jgi:tRNA(Ile)-lysidine synthase
VNDLYEQAISNHKKNLVEYKGNELHIPVLKLKKVSPLSTILFEIIRHFHFSSQQVHDVVHLLDAEQGKFVQSATHRIIRNRNWLIITPIDHRVSSNLVINETDSIIQYAGGTLEISDASTDHINFSSSPGTAELDKRRVKFPLILRKWKAGDYFYPLGMKKKKKVSRFLIDQKLSPTDKEKVWVLEADKRICWVVGMRIDERFKIVASTDEVIKIKLTS